MQKKIYIFALAATGAGISGGDRIFIEFARRWAKICSITIYVWKEGYEMCQRQGLDKSNIKLQISKMKPWVNLGFIVNYLARIIEGIRIGLILNLGNNQNTIVYSASEFWMDSLPVFFLKLRHPKIKWVAAWFQTAPNPLIGYSDGKRETTYKLSAFYHWFMQLPIKPLIEKLADFVLVNNEEEKKLFPAIKRQGKVIIVLGAVNTKEIANWRVRFQNLPKIYDGVFQGRFHPQKGVLELVDIWKRVVDEKPDAKLVMIGDGPLRKNVELRIKNLQLSNNIILKGYLFDGEEKYRIFAQSKIVVHPAFYDSGGMASAEAMAFGLPCIGFNLESYKSYYPKGMIKVKIGDLRSFAGCVLELLSDESKRKKIGRNVLNMINISWSWDQRAKEVLKNI